MKIIKIDSLENFSGTVLVPVFETAAKDLVPIQFEGLEISSKVFYGKKDSYYIAEKNDTIFIFIGLGKTTDYKSLKTIFRRIAFKEKDTFSSNVSLFLPDVFTEEQVEAAILGLFLGTYNLGHYKKRDNHPFLNANFVLELFSANPLIRL